MDYYRKTYPDLAEFTDTDLVAHFNEFGIQEGRHGAAAALRENFVPRVTQCASVLEIGPFCAPCIVGQHVSYFDVLDGPQLQKRAETIGYPIKMVPDVTFASPTGNLEVVDRSFDAVFSSHCIEHQPDLVDHLLQVERILAPGGCYFLLIPDKRYCFDQPIPPSTIAHIVAAHQRQRKVHRLESVIEHRALTTHNDASRHWAGDHSDPGWETSIPQRVLSAVAEFDASNGEYVDVHAWQFTPDSFAQNLRALKQMDLIALDVENVYATPAGRLEFAAILKKP